LKSIDSPRIALHCRRPGDKPVQGFSGHRDEKIHERSTHLDLDSKRRALAKLRPLAK